MNSPWTFFLCGGLSVLVLSGLGIYLIIQAQASKRKAQLSQSWPVAKGIINKTDIKTLADDSPTTYVPFVSYTYMVEGKIYEGQQIAFGRETGFRSHQKAVEYMAPYPVDAEVSLHYNPEKPSEAVLRQIAQGTKVGLVIGIILLVISTCVVFFMAFAFFKLITG